MDPVIDFDYDVVVIGSGSGNAPSALRLTGNGARFGARFGDRFGDRFGVPEGLVRLSIEHAMVGAGNG